MARIEMKEFLMADFQFFSFPGSEISNGPFFGD